MKKLGIWLSVAQVMEQAHDVLTKWLHLWMNFDPIAAFGNRVLAMKRSPTEALWHARHAIAASMDTWALLSLCVDPLGQSVRYGSVAALGSALPNLRFRQPAIPLIVDKYAFREVAFRGPAQYRGADA